MGNQQERLELDMAWLAGFWEGEGYISLCKCSHTSKRQLGNIRYVPSMGICNTDYEFLPPIKELLDSIPVAFCVHMARIVGIGKKPKWEIRIKGMKKIRTLCERLLPFLKGQKKRRAEKMIAFCDMREKKLSISHQAPYGIEEEAFYKEMYSFKGRVETKILNDFTSCAAIASQ